MAEAKQQLIHQLRNWRNEKKMILFENWKIKTNQLPFLNVI